MFITKIGGDNEKKRNLCNFFRELGISVMF